MQKRRKKKKKTKEEKLGKEYLQNHKLQCDPNPDDFMARIVKDATKVLLKGKTS